MIGRCVANRPYMYLPLKGDTNDYSVNAQNPSNTGVTTTTGQFGETNGAYEWDATTDYLEWAGSIADAVAGYSNNNLTVFYFVNLNALGATASHTLSSYNTSARGFITNMTSTDTYTQWQIANSGTFEQSRFFATASTSVWNCYAINSKNFDVNDNEVKLFLNGVEETVDSGSAFIQKTITTSNVAMRLGRRVDGGNSFTGKLHTFRIYSNSLSKGSINILNNEKGRIRA